MLPQTGLYSGVVLQLLTQLVYCGEAVVVVVPAIGVLDGDGLGLEVAVVVLLVAVLGAGDGLGLVFWGIWLPVAVGKRTGPAICRFHFMDEASTDWYKQKIAVKKKYIVWKREKNGCSFWKI